LRLRVKDVDFDRKEITVRDGKGGKDRHTMLPRTLVEPLRREVERAATLHAADLAAGFGAVWLPHALARKYPNAPRELGWQYVFPAQRRSRDPRDGIERRHHFDDALLSRALKRGRREAAVAKPVSAHTLRIRSRRICWRRGRTSVPCRSCWATRTWRPRRSTRMCSIAAGVVW
jgi:integrase